MTLIRLLSRDLSVSERDLALSLVGSPLLALALVVVAWALWSVS